MRRGRTARPLSGRVPSGTASALRYALISERVSRAGARGMESSLSVAGTCWGIGGVTLTSHRYFQRNASVKASGSARQASSPSDLSADKALPGDDAIAIFGIAPVSLWLEDFSGVKTLFEAWRAAGIRDLRAFLLENRTKVEECARKIRVLKVNQATLRMFDAASLEDLVANLDRVFRGDMFETQID